MARRQSENEVEDAVITWLRQEGWIVRRQHVIHPAYTKDGRCVGNVGEIGECDWRAMRSMPGTGVAMFFEFEAKGNRRKPSPEQREYMAKRKHQRILCIWADSKAAFLEKYRAVFNAGS